jgi:hypothetical protein
MRDRTRWFGAIRRREGIESVNLIAGMAVSLQLSATKEHARAAL